MKSLYFYQTEIGKVSIAENGGQITNVYFEEDDISIDFEIKETELLKTAGKQLLEYFAGQRKNFKLPLMSVGTEFQCQVWQALRHIPYGVTVSYKDIAKKINHERAARAVGMANNKNPIPIFIPCHRVIGANGKLVGYGGGLEIKRFLLELERLYV